MIRDSIIVIDYGSGNLRSAAKAFERACVDEGLDFDVRISSDPEEILKASRLVLPGQGAFGDCMGGLQAIPGMVEALNQRVMHDGAPFFGICVGMQLMATRGLEHGEHNGLGWIEGEVVPLAPADESLKIPHMGWNETEIAPYQKEMNEEPHVVLRSIEKDTHYYFVHSFMVQCKNKHDILATTNYGGEVTAIIGRDNMIGVQFHPEKSQDAGLRLIADFLKWNP